MSVAGVVLAAGQGKRMRSRRPKVLHTVAGRSLLDHVLRALRSAGIDELVVVTGHGAEEVEAAVGDGAVTVRQDPQRGTADALRIGLGRLSPATDQVLVTVGDAPLIGTDLFRALLAAQRDQGAAVALLSARVPDPAGYGRVVRGEDGGATAVVEEADADAATRAIDEVNAGSYAFDGAWLRARLADVPASASGEYYLTDLVGLAVADGRRVAVVSADRPERVLGINDRVALAAAETWLRQEIAERHMLAGVTIVDPATTYIDADVEIGEDARIEPWTVLAGRTRIGEEACIGPHAQVHDSEIGPRSRVWSSVVEASSVGEEVEIGPFAHLRPGCQIGPRCRIGNFAELKQASVGSGSQLHHFGYIGDAELGEGVNVGAGTVTANYDGQQKHRTVIGDGAFLGVDSLLRAPVSIGPGARTGAGAVVTRDVPPGTTVVGMPARAIGARRSTSERSPS